MCNPVNEINQEGSILMLGPACSIKGGMSSVIKIYQEAGVFEHNKISYLSTVSPGNKLNKALQFFSVVLRLLQILFKQPSIKILHCHSASYGSFYRKSIITLISKFFGKKAILHIHGAEFQQFYENAPLFLQYYIQAILGYCDQVICLSPQWQTFIKPINSTAKTAVLYNPVKLPLLNDKGSRKSQNEPALFLFLGRLCERKGVSDIIQAAQKVQSKNIKIQLYGDGDLAYYRQLVLKLGVSHLVEVFSWVEDKEKEALLQQADVLVLPSYHEALPMAVLEAIAFGLPIIATEVGGISEAVEEGLNGFLVRPGCIQELADKMDQLAAEQGLREAMGLRSRKLAEKKFDIQNVHMELKKLYQALLSDSQPIKGVYS